MALAIAVTLHVLAVTIWVGGMFFAHQCLRPVAASQLDPPMRLRLWVGVFSRFFPWVWVAVVATLATGLWIIFFIFGGFASTRLFVHIMFGLGLLMMAIFMLVYFSPYQRLKTAVAKENWQDGGKQLARIRHLVGVNTIIGLLTIALASGGRYLIA